MKKLINAIKMLGVDAINSANSGHSGIAIGAAPIIFALYKDHLNIDYKNENWLNRDRFVLSAGHGSALLYATLFAFNLGYTIDDLKQFRQLDSNTPGHPEKENSFVETTTGPLGQGIATSIGMAIAQKYLNNLLGEVINHRIYTVCGDGCLQEGQSYEAMSIAGNMELDNIILLHDSNNIQIDTQVSEVSSENLKLRMESMNWHYLLVEDGSDYQKISKAIEEAKKIKKPVFIEIRTIIGQDSVWAGTSQVHGKPLGLENRNKLAHKLNWEYAPFDLPQDFFKELQTKFYQRCQVAIDKYNKELQNLSVEKRELFVKVIDEKEWANLELQVFDDEASTRELTKRLLNQLQDKYSLLGGSADLVGSTYVKGAKGTLSKNNKLGRNLPFGVREHAMAAIANGIATYKGLKVITGTFLSFADYEKPALRLGALMDIPTLSFFSHDSLFVGEDGPTHQPIEQLALLRGIPNHTVFRPYNSLELNFAFQWYIKNKKPTSIVTTRQNLNNQQGLKENIEKGGYIFKKEKAKTFVTLIASGSEVDFALELLKKYNNDQIRIVSVPSLSLLRQQPQPYLEELAPKESVTYVFEASNDTSWKDLFPHAKLHILKSFGSSGKGIEVYKKFGFDVNKVDLKFDK